MDRDEVFFVRKTKECLAESDLSQQMFFLQLQNNGQNKTEVQM
jgi:hypothetical protein